MILLWIRCSTMCAHHPEVLPITKSDANISVGAPIMWQETALNQSRLANIFLVSAVTASIRPAISKILILDRLRDGWARLRPRVGQLLSNLPSLASAGATFLCASRVIGVEPSPESLIFHHSSALGKGEVVGSIPTGSTAARSTT